MTPKPERHALAAVCNALTTNGNVNLLEFWQAALTPTKARGAVVRVEVTDRSIATALALDGGKGPRVVRVGPVRWTVDTPREALERLTTDDVLPVSWAGDTSRGWWCPLCKGKGTAYSALRVGPKPGDTVLASPDPVPCFCRDEVPSIPDLVAWSSLGVETIQRAEHLARETASRLRSWGVRPPVVRVTGDDGRVVERERPWRVVWRVADPAALCGSAVPPRRGFPDAVLSHEDRQYSTWQDAYSEVMRALPSGSKAQSLGVAWARGIAAGYCAQWSDPRPNPYEPLHALLGMGLALDAITDDALVLVVPPL